MKNLKGNGGITLIALVITIIVLIILAGISIAMTAGQNGILTNAKDATVQNAFGNAKDKIALLANEAVHDVYKEVYVNNTGSASNIGSAIRTKIETYVTSAKTEIEGFLGNKTDGLTVDTTNHKITLKYSDGSTISTTIDENGTLGEWN